MQNRIKERIKEYGIVQKDLAIKLGMTTVSLSQMVKAQSLKIETYEKFAKAMNVPVWRLCLSNEEIADIIATSQVEMSHKLKCPICGGALKLVPDND